MKERGFWTLVAAPGLAVASWLLAFFVLGGSVVMATPGDRSLVAIIQPASIGSIDSGRLPARVNRVPANDLAVCGGTWIVETVDNAGDVGAFSSLALERTRPYTPHISYFDLTNQGLKHAWLDGTTWLSETIDDGCGKTSLALVPASPYTPAISYDGCEHHIKFAWPAGTNWFSMTVPGTYAGRSSLALEPTDPYTPHISYFWDLGGVKSVHHAYLSGTTWLNGMWVYEAVEPPGSEVGRSSSLSLESTYPYTPHISYRSRIGDSDLRYAWLSGTVWLTKTVDSVGDVGKHTSLALDSNGNPHISYFDDTKNALKYAWLSGTTWFSQTVDNIGEPPYDRGRSSLELDQSDVPYVSYYDATNGDLRLAFSDGTVWFSQTVDSAGDVGQFSSLALDELGCPHISYYDATNGDLKIAKVQTPCSRPPTNPPSCQVHNLDHDAEDWGVYCEGAPIWNKRNVPSPLLDGKSLQCSIVGGAPYSNVHCYRNLLLVPSADVFTLSMSFWFSPTTTCNNQGEPSVIQALEFTMNKWLQDKRYEWALQWQNVGTGAPQWRYWDGLDWITPSPAIPQCLEAKQWHTFALEGAIVDGQVHYQRFAIDGNQHILDLTVPPVSTSGESDRLAIAVQLDGNATQSPYDLFVDQVDLLRNPACQLYLPIVLKRSSPRSTLSHP